MLKQTSIAKITRPRLPKVLFRRRLFGLLDKGLRSPVTWVNGPAGSGKTTLVASYLDARKLPCLWYQLDEGDSDIATFFYYLGLAAQKAAPRHRTRLPLFTMEYMRGISTFTKRYFESLCSRLKPPYVIVLDNYHHIPPESPFHDVIRDALSVISEGITVMFVSRSGPPPSLSLLRTYNKMHFIGWEELKFDMKETGSLLGLGQRRGPTGDMLKQLYRMTDGWAAGLMLMMERLRTSGMGPGEAELFKPDELFEYFATELFEKTDRKMQDFLLKTAFLRRLAPISAAELTTRTDAGALLATLSRNHYFTEQRSISDPVYQYHPLFREFLQARARETYSEQEMLAVLRRAAQIAEDSGQIEDAAELYRLAAEWKSFARLVLGNATAMVSQGRYRSLEGWLKAIPEDVFSREPWLLYWMGVCRMPFALLEGRGYFEKAFTLFKINHDVSGVFLAWSGVVESIIQERGNLGQMDPWIALLDELMKEFPVFPSPQVEGHVTCNIFMSLSLRQPWHPAFDRWKEKAMGLMNSDVDANLRLLTGYYLFTHFIQVGDQPMCERAMDTIRRLSDAKKDVSPLAYIMGKQAEVWFAWTTCDYEHCLTAMHEGLQKSRDTGVHLYDNWLLMVGAKAAEDSGDLRLAEELLRKMGAGLEHGRPLDKYYYYGLAGWHCMLNHDMEGMLSMNTTSLELGTKIGYRENEARGLLNVAYYLRIMGKYEQAKERIAQALEIARRMKSPLLTFYCQLKGADIAFAEGKAKTALRSLLEAMTLGREKGYAAFNYSNWLPEEMSFLCMKALEAEIEPDFAAEIIRKRKLVPESPPLHIENWPWPVKIFTLGGFKLFVNDKLVEFTGKVQKKPLQLLKSLIAAGGKEIREDQLTFLLWSDAEGDAAHKALEVNIIRLRRLLGTSDAVVVKEGRVTLDPRICWVDVRAFERMLDGAEPRAPRARSSELKGGKKKSAADADIAMLEKAFDLYKGPFLAEDPEPWSVSFREKLRDKFLHSVKALGAHLEQSRKYKEALRVYQRGIDVDDLAEPYYQRMMNCYVRLGRHAEALAVYNRCKKTFTACGVEPSEETEALRDSLRRQK